MVKVTLEGQTIKWLLASVNINRIFLLINNKKKVCCLSLLLFGFCLINE